MAGNSNSGKRAGGKDFAPRIRSMFDRALEKLELRGDADKLMEAALKEDFVGTVQRMAAYAPKQVDMSVDQTVTIDTTQITEETLRGLFTSNDTDKGTSPELH
jgi:hypothetical protein